MEHDIFYNKLSCDYKQPLPTNLEKVILLSIIYETFWYIVHIWVFLRNHRKQLLFVKLTQIPLWLPLLLKKIFFLLISFFIPSKCC